MRQMRMTTEMTALHSTSPLAWHCTLSTPYNASTESAHHERAQSCFLCTFHHTHIGSSSSLVRTPLTTMAIDVVVVSSTWLPPFHLFAFLLSVFLFSLFHLSDEQQPELNKKIIENLCDSATDGGEGTCDVLYLHRLAHVPIFPLSCDRPSKYRCMRCGKGSKYMKMQGKFTGPTYFTYGRTWHGETHKQAERGSDLVLNVLVFARQRMGPKLMDFSKPEH